ncbi:MAG TPA: PEGA domain-containing protein [Gallionella sp.]|nr:PEGA domain-containing protein [Gallionella sp.]
MEERGNKTIMCSVLFLDIVEYSKKSVAGQISLKDRFNSYLSSAIRDVPMTDRIILDTGDGAAINFLGDVEDALKAALSLRESLLNEEPDVDHPLLVRMGINLGPVRLVRDLNGQPNIVGDGINVAQRVMGFADAAQILVSRSYYDAVSRLSPQYAGMFHYQGSRTDKHVREHEVYAIGYPGDKTTHRRIAAPTDSEPSEYTMAAALQRTKAIWHTATAKLDSLIELMIIRYRQAEPQQRALYAAFAAIPVLLLIVLLANLPRHGAAQPPGAAEPQASSTKPSLAVAPEAPSVPSAPDLAKKEATPAHAQTVTKTKKKKGESKIAKANPKAKSQEKAKSQHPDSQPTTSSNNTTEHNSTSTTSNGGKKAYISVTCVEGTDVFVDGILKGRVGSSPLNVAVPPGNHTVIVSHTSRGVFTQSVELSSGKTVHIKPNLCN